MRLINKKTHLLEWFNEGDVPPYIILSHRWNGLETSLQEYTQQCQQPREKHCAGVAKIFAFCDYIDDRREQYAWIDTCCIDKTSSSELQEAIASMWKWYQNSTVCVVFLNDVKASELGRDFGKSLWWTRGWTLQELLAPEYQLFVDQDWKHIGSRMDLAATISHITRVPIDCMGDWWEIQRVPVGQRMSWLSRRQTTRTEDMAYCMLGIFDVSMTMLYGEGGKAFWRLQKKILKDIDDETIFLWTYPRTPYDPNPRSTVLAPDPSCFEAHRSLSFYRDTYFQRDPCRVTSRGLDLEIYTTRSTILNDEIEVPLNCRRSAGGRPCLQLKRYLSTDNSSYMWMRINHSDIRILGDNEYLMPTSEQEEYMEQHRATQVSARQASPMFSKHAEHTTPHRMLFDFENEPVRRKIFVH